MAHAVMARPRICLDSRTQSPPLRHLPRQREVPARPSLTSLPLMNLPTSDEPTSDEPTSDEPNSDEPTSDESTSDEPTSDEPTPHLKTQIKREEKEKPRHSDSGQEWDGGQELDSR